jgi:hypothetical protein
MIDEPLGRRLVGLARAALEARVRGQRLPAVPPDLDGPTSGLFVTVYCAGSLRGCLGTLDARERLGQALVRLAADVSHEDHRFHPIAPRELAQVRVSVSILYPAERVIDLSTIEIGRDGLIVEQGRRRGLLLPQVAVEHGWDRETLLRQTCVKAGLPPDAWQRGATVLRFAAEVFGEELTFSG